MAWKCDKVDCGEVERKTRAWHNPFLGWSHTAQGRWMHVTHFFDRGSISGRKSLHHELRRTRYGKRMRRNGSQGYAYPALSLSFEEPLSLLVKFGALIGRSCVLPFPICGPWGLDVWCETSYRRI